MLTTTELLPVIITMIGVGVALAGFMFTVMLVFFRMLNQRISESEARLTQRINAVEGRMQRQEQETAEIKGSLNVIQSALPLRIGD